MNLRPSGYEPDELPGCSTPRFGVGKMTEGGSRRKEFVQKRRGGPRRLLGAHGKNNWQTLVLCYPAGPVFSDGGRSSMVELQIVILVVAGSSPVGHPIFQRGIDCASPRGRDGQHQRHESASFHGCHRERQPPRRGRPLSAQAGHRGVARSGGGYLQGWP